MKKGNKFFNVIVTIAIITLICVVGYAAYYGNTIPKFPGKIR